MECRNWNVGRLHIIKRRYNDPPQWGWLLWGATKGQRVNAISFPNTTLDVWMGCTLWTFRWSRA